MGYNKPDFPAVVADGIVLHFLARPTVVKDSTCQSVVQSTSLSIVFFGGMD
jgi:hypothetical protein